MPDNSTLDSFIISQPSTYFLTVTDTNNCTQTDIINVTETCPPHIYIPITFSPNSNILVNRIFKPSTMFVDSYTMKIFDRWGEEIYSGNEKDEGWNGTFKNNDCKSDMFIWVITYFGKYTADIIAGETIEGTVYLIR